MRTLLALAILLLALPVASAQVVQPTGCGPISLVATAPQAVGPGETGEIRVSIKNENGQRAVDATVAAETSSKGWTFMSAETLTVTVPAGQTGTVTFTVSPGEDAEGDATVNLATTGACAPPGGIPCPTGAPSNACTTQGPPQTVVVGFAAPDGFTIPGLENVTLPLPYLLAGLLLIVAAIAVPLILRKRRPLRALADCPEPLKPVRPGKGASFPIELVNPSDTTRKVDLAVGPVPEGWSAFLPLPDIQLAAKEKRSLWLMVRAPAEARHGDQADVEVTATDTGRPERPNLVRVRAEVRDDAPDAAGL